ncbi:MAG: sodium/solute symporter [Gemmatimonadetes bacterium]|nr:sodium/solute symporter [Gemmatimonadota bacterium]
MRPFNTLDLGVLVLYLAGVIVWGAWLGRGQHGGRDYFLGNRELPWLAVLLSIVATETSTLTFLSIPGVAYVGTLAFLQLTFGYLAGRAVVAVVLLPAYYRGDLATAYQLLESRFGRATRRFTSAIFMVTRLLADSVRLFATAIPLAFITGWPYGLSILVIGAVTLVYTYLGGIKAVVWVDALQMAIYLLGAAAAVVALQLLVPGGWSGILSEAARAGKTSVLDFSVTAAAPYTFWAGLVGGGFLSMASHGTDQLIVQRLLTCHDLRASQKALVGSGVVVIGQFALFLAIGLGLWAFYGGQAFPRTDEIFARFIVEELPPGITGLLIAGVFAAAMSTLSSSINSLASASAYDFFAPALRVDRDDQRTLRAGKLFTLLWAMLLVGGAIVFIPLSRQAAAVEVALGIASLVYGGLLGAFALGLLLPASRQGHAMVAMAAGIGAVAVLWVVARQSVAWPWYVFIGTAVTFAVGSVAARLAPATAFAQPNAGPPREGIAAEGSE